MFEGYQLFLIILSYLLLLFLVAYYAEKQERRGRSVVSNPYIYSLSLAVYCTSWTFYGSVGKAATSGFSFLTIYLGPTLIMCLWPMLLRKIIGIAKRFRITTISDFIGSRYGNSIALSTLVTVVAVIGIIPYIGLQIKAIINTFTILAGQTKGTAEAGWFITLVLGIFAIMFGARRLDASERHEGLVFAIAFESIIKLVAFLAVGVFVTFGLFDGFYDIFEKIKETPYGDLLYLGTGTSVSYHEWASLLFLSMMAIMFLPRQFHVTVVENSDVNHVSKAIWLFPFYLFLMNIFVMPIALGGLLLGGSQSDADLFVLTIPLGQKEHLLALFVFIGGFSAATGMVIVESLALSTMVMNNIITPAIFRFNQMRGFPIIMLFLKRMVILACAFLGYFFAVSIGEFYTLVDIGLKSFEAVTIFAPALILGLYWKRGSKAGAFAGILGGFMVWMYTLLIPAMFKAGILSEDGFFMTMLQSDLLNPRALFGVSGFDKWGHSLFWGLMVNLFLYFGFSILMRRSSEEDRQALLFVESFTPVMRSGYRSYSIEDVETTLSQYLGRQEALDILQVFMMKHNMKREALTHTDYILLQDEAERVLSGVLGSALARIIFEDKLTLTEEERGDLSSSVKEMTSMLRFSRKELAEANQNLAYLKEFSENIIESVPMGIVTTEADLHITSWNRQMEQLAEASKEKVIHRSLTQVLPWLSIPDFTRTAQQEFTVETPMHTTFRVNISQLKDPSGGFVIILEDITEKLKLEEQLQQTTKLASLGRMTAGISHEIGNPLASISSLVQELLSLRSLESENEDRSFSDESLRMINFHIERIANIVRSLGDFARISSPDKVMTNVAEILEKTVNLVQYDKRFKQVNLVTDIEEVRSVPLSPDKVQQVFLNLILNALDAMPQGGELTISLREQNRFVVIEVSDTGTGMEDEVLDRIFDPFFTTKPLGKGTGLGLSICYGIIKEHDGTITARSRKGAGTTFTVKLPFE